MTSKFTDESIGQPGQVDLTNCDREPIHKLGKVQSFGFLLGTSLDWIASCASENIANFLGRTAEDVVGEHLPDLLGGESVHRIRNRLQFLRGQEGVERVRKLRVGDDGPVFDCSVHLSGETIVLEFEPVQGNAETDDDIGAVRTMMSRLADTDSVARFCNDAARYLQALTRFDRVMVYRFLHDGSGEVVAEAKVRSLEPFLNLRYPASDIPQQARALYLANPIRIIANVSDRGVALYPERAPSGEVLDLSQSVLRSVSSIHLEYLANMGVAASMSVSIIVDGKLWGLFACHHGAPMALGQAVRAATELFGQMFSLLLSGKLNAESIRTDDQVRQLTNTFTSSVLPNEQAVHQIVPLLQEFASVVDAHGVGVALEGEVHLEGTTPTTDEFAQIVKFLNRSSANAIFTSHELSSVMPEAADFVQRAAGILAIPISRSPRDYIVFFRKEVIKTVDWAGNPAKPATVGPNGIRLTPRKSFEAWRAIVERQSEPWTPSDLRAASQLRLTLLEVVLRLSEEATRERKSAQERQELLVAELNHRVRNILGLVKGLISQSRSKELSTTEYVAILNSRIQALARAHDQITQKNWAASSFADLLHTEAKSYLMDKADRVVLQGADYLLEPQAFSTVALVVHELVTNAAKYGALSDRRGTILVTTRLADSGALQIVWEEKGGPAVQPPTRRGFGSTLVERSVPYELNGKASIEFRLAGLRAQFEIPAVYVKRPEKVAKSSAVAGDTATVAQVETPNSVLIVEDNLIIGMEAESLFQGLGCQTVDVVGNLDEAYGALNDRDFDLVLLDVNLGNQTSFALAEELAAKGVKIAFASGYGDTGNYPETLRAVPRVAKPYDRDAIIKLLLVD
ncbi:MAG: HWE histidine kinase domain-containing protein [Kiloniellaceae bacterium]